VSSKPGKSSWNHEIHEIHEQEKLGADPWLNHEGQERSADSLSARFWKIWPIDAHGHGWPRSFLNQPWRRPAPFFFNFLIFNF
jgi:hypothetical protein